MNQMSEPEEQPKRLMRWDRCHEINRMVDDFMELQEMSPTEIKRYCGGNNRHA